MQLIVYSMYMTFGFHIFNFRDKTDGFDFQLIYNSIGPIVECRSEEQLAIVKVDVKALTVSDVMLAMIGNPFSVVYLSVVLLRH